MRLIILINIERTEVFQNQMSYKRRNQQTKTQLIFSVAIFDINGGAAFLLSTYESRDFDHNFYGVCIYVEMVATATALG